MHWKSWRMAGAPCALSFITLLLSGLIAAAQTPTPANAQQTPANAQQTPASAQQTPANAPPAFSCDQNATRPRAGGASVAQTAGESLQHKNWQPIGGLIEFTINSFTAIDADAAVTTCFRWKVESGTSAPFVEQRPVRVDLSNGGKVLKVTVVVPDPAPTGNATNPFWDAAVVRAIWLVPLVEVRIVALKANTPGAEKASAPGAEKANLTAADVWTEIGITHPFVSLLLALAVVVLAFVVLGIVVTKRVEHKGIRHANWLLRIISTPSATKACRSFRLFFGPSRSPARRSTWCPCRASLSRSPPER